MHIGRPDLGHADSNSHALGKARGQYTTRRARADDYVVEGLARQGHSNQFKAIQNLPHDRIEILARIAFRARSGDHVAHAIAQHDALDL